MSDLRRGRLYWVNLDKWRPALLLSADVRNSRASDVIVVPCSTVRRPAPTHVELRRREGGIHAASVLKCEQITTVHRSDLRPEPLGAGLSGARMRQVERAVLRAIDVAVPLE